MSTEFSTSEDYLTESEQALLLKIARDTLTEYLADRSLPGLDTYTLTDTLRELHGAFVTLRNRGELRGCVGYAANLEPLARAVQLNTVNAAAHDCRFAPVTLAEAPSITIEISALGHGDTPEKPFKRVHDLSEIVIGRDGLYIEQPPMRGGILLPQVAVEQGWGVAQFLSAVCRKAGYPDGAWRLAEYKLYRFTAQHFAEV
ncbi:MAG: AmmeMemoRadiSam system protein A [Candidatus Hydrogenedentes bacterium]|nr:AmmeMemoRadiSam system protein A [Candidatus Hydrogenedentota bacterium]